MAYVRCESISVSSPAAGKILAIRVDEGDSVRKGDTLFIMDTLPLTFKILQLEARMKAIDRKIDSRRIRLGMLGRKKEEMKVLVESGAASENKLRDIEDQIGIEVAGMRALEMERRALGYSLEELRKRKSDLVVTSPARGEILSVRIKEGIIYPSGVPGVDVCLTESFYVEAFFREKFVKFLQKGKPVKVMGPHERIEGRIEEVLRRTFYDQYEDETYVIVKIQMNSMPEDWKKKDFRVTVKVRR
ncbi:MAG: biotin/lipoyl-binding protein [Thermotogae bacterium]|nr:biotin/lipoyl-binding protein [Thermotogota bacterium]